MIYIYRRKVSIILILIFSMFFILPCISRAQGRMEIKTEKNQIKKGEEFKISLEISDASISALTAWIYFDETKIEFVSGPDNSNIIDNRIVYTWYDQNGGNTPIENGEIANFTFKAKEEGEVVLGIGGEFYNSKGESVDINFENSHIFIGEKPKEVKQEENSSNNTDPNNSNLDVLRLNEVGISPDFDKNIKEYYFIADESISNLEVTALPENPNATVNITGNTNLKNGLNKIKIEVVSENKKNKSEYIINVTKTDDIEDANANLENLAIEGGTLSPEFDNNITKYNTEVEDKMEKLNILAIAEDERAKVEIVGGEKLEYGNNTMNIKVTAVNGITTKNYVVNVYRRTKEEEQQAEKEQEESQEQAENIIENMEKQPEQNVQENIEQDQDQKNNYLWIIALVVIAIIIILIVVYIKKKSEKTY